MTRTIRILKDDYDRFVEIQKQRPQDTTNAETFNYLIRVFEESPSRLRNPGGASSIIDADNLRIVTPATLAEKLYADKQRMDALKSNNKEVMEHKE